VSLVLVAAALWPGVPLTPALLLMTPLLPISRLRPLSVLFCSAFLHAVISVALSSAMAIGRSKGFMSDAPFLSFFG
jgi:hypothetical protein